MLLTYHRLLIVCAVEMVTWTFRSPWPSKVIVLKVSWIHRVTVWFFVLMSFRFLWFWGNISFVWFGRRFLDRCVTAGVVVEVRFGWVRWNRLRSSGAVRRPWHSVGFVFGVRLRHRFVQGILFGRVCWDVRWWPKTKMYTCRERRNKVIFLKGHGC